MKQREHRLGVSESTLVKRHLKIESSGPEGIQEALAEIDQLYGMDSVSFDQERSRLDLAYNAVRLSIDDIAAILERHGIDIAPGWWNHFKEEHYRFVDQNVKDNAQKEPWSCH